MGRSGGTNAYPAPVPVGSPPGKAKSTAPGSCRALMYVCVVLHGVASSTDLSRSTARPAFSRSSSRGNRARTACRITSSSFGW